MPGIASTLAHARSVPARLERARALPVLASLCVVQLGIGLWVALASTHDHLLWYSGGDATEYWTASWWLSHGTLGQTLIGYGVPVLWAWVPPLTGATMLSGLPPIVAIQFVGLVPLALVLFWRVADLLFGRRFAWWATALWVAGPPLLYAGFSPGFAPQFRELFLAPHWFGLTDMADFPSLVAVLATAWAALRLLDRPTVGDGVLTGLLAGVAIGLKPANGFFVPALLVLLAGVRRARPLLACGAAFVPALVTLAVWKARGRGTLPILADGSVHETAGQRPLAAINSSPYLTFDWHHLTSELGDLSSVFWSIRLLEFVAIAGAIAVLRRDRLKGAFVILWFGAYCLLKGSSTTSSIVSLSYFRFVEPGLPAFVLLAAGLVFLLPRRGRAFSAPARAAPLPGGRRTLVAAVAVLAVVPLGVVAAARPATSAVYVWVPSLANDAPLSSSLTATAQVTGDSVRLTWRPAEMHGSNGYYVVYRSHSGDGCSAPGEGAVECQLSMDVAGMTRNTSFVDRPSPGGTWWYRVALMANYRAVADGSDLMLMGPATAVAVPAR